MPSKDTDTGTGKGRSIIVETVTRLMVPFIQLFALYVIIHGAGGPGGGFQGGVIFASSFVLYVVAFGIVKAGNRFSERANIVLFSTGVYLYAGVGLLCILFSYGAAQFLNYGYIPLTHHFEENRALGMDLVEIGIGITVMAVITSIFFNLVWKREEIVEEGGED
ncbi:MAG: multicomponent Na+:H+ antiporter subunit B [Candidatus Methanophagaceae archaeon]|nr:MAG: multicomponent Na+:H+ antiporter subunit B [Methanophagales archaeon]KAF5431996.1 multicomponent Na+:H+ antiporter subunit B [Methanophagales archaeon]